MAKMNVILVLLNKDSFLHALNSLNFNNVNLVAIIMDGLNGKFLKLRNKNIPGFSFATMSSLLIEGKNFVWLISGWINNIGDIWRMKKFLMNKDIPEDNIVNFEIFSHINTEWLANLRYIEKNGADFFATGISYMEVGLDLRYIPYRQGVNLACSNQDLHQGYLTAKYVFEHVAPSTIKFVLIGLTPYSFRYDNAESFSVCSRNLQYLFALKNAEKKTFHDLLLEFLIDDTVKNIFTKITAQQADLNFEKLKNTNNFDLPANAVINWEGELNNLTKKLRPQVIQKNFQILTDYIKLCLNNGAKPVGVVFPFAPMIQKNYDKELLEHFRLMIHQLEESYDFTCIDLFDMKLDDDCFYNMAHLNLKGAALTSTALSVRLYEENFLSPEDFRGMSYNYFDLLSGVTYAEDYNAFIELMFKKTVTLIRRKNKIKIGFVLYDTSMWCGDDLYNYFDSNELFDPTIFLCLRNDRPNDKLVIKDFLHGVEQFKSRRLNVVAIDDMNFSLPTQDVLIFLTPYIYVLPRAFQFSNLTPKTLLVYIPYACNMTGFNIYDISIYHLGWKLFFDTQFHIDLLEKECQTGMPRGLYSGYPKLDFFYKNPESFKFNWKMTRPNAKKIIYAPHWTINTGIEYSTFQYNFKFFYDFAKAHLETSWVFKPHPNLLFSAVESGLFPSTEAFEEYLQAWNDLPNAQVYTGAYYQELFATSDGMIMDCASWIGEYQYTHKPMIFLTRDTQEFNDLGKEIMKVLYRVEGKNLNEIANFIKIIFIESDDPKFTDRLNFFDKHLNYFKYNGMLAGEFIYRSILRDFIL